MPSETGIKLNPQTPLKNPKWTYMPATLTTKGSEVHQGIWILIPLLKLHRPEAKHAHMSLVKHCTLIQWLPQAA
jgi:hypothetical protein